MIHRLRFVLPALFARLRRRPQESARPLRGVVKNVIVVPSPDPRFREALFILRDDYFLDPDRDRDALMREAREAARRCAVPAAPRPSRRVLWLLAPLPVLLALGALRAFGML